MEQHEQPRGVLAPNVPRPRVRITGGESPGPGTRTPTKSTTGTSNLASVHSAEGESSRGQSREQSREPPKEYARSSSKERPLASNHSRDSSREPLKEPTREKSREPARKLFRELSRDGSIGDSREHDEKKPRLSAEPSSSDTRYSNASGSIRDANRPPSHELAKPAPREQSREHARVPVTAANKRTEADMATMLSSGYIAVHPQLWDFLPSGSHVRYVKKDTAGGLSRCERFCPGGFVRNHFTSVGKKMLTLGSSAQNITGGMSFPLAYDEIEELWKKYDPGAFIEIHLIRGSLAEKKTQIDSLLAANALLIKRVDLLTSRINALENEQK